MDKTKTSRGQKLPKNINPLETLKSIGDSTVTSFKEDLVKKVPEDILEQLLNIHPVKKYSGEITPGESIEMKDVFSGQIEEKKKVEKQLHFERTVREEEEVTIQEKSNELKMQLNVLTEKVDELTSPIQELREEAKVAKLQAPSDPGVYHILFLQQIIDFVISFRKNIESAVTWLGATNKRAEKKNYWAKYKKHGGKFLLSADHYLTRSAG